MLDPRRWLAEQIGCDPGELQLAGAVVRGLDGVEQAEYLRDDTAAGSVVVTGVHRPIREPPFRIVLVTWSGGQRTMRTGADAVVEC